MLAAGALAEVEALLRLGLDPGLPAMRAHGVPELAAVLRGQNTLADARRRIITATVRYTRRQETWFRHHTLAPASRTLVIDKPVTDFEQQMQTLAWVRDVLLRNPG